MWHWEDSSREYLLSSASTSQFALSNGTRRRSLTFTKVEPDGFALIARSTSEKCTRITVARPLH